MSILYKTIPVTEIFLDEKNPRSPSVADQREAIRAMLDDQEDQLVNLARDICESGLDPTKRLLVFEEEGRLVDGDGNRRLTALKILETPPLASSHPNLQRKFEALRNTYKKYPREVDCVVLKSRGAAHHWIEINHGGRLDGRGQIPWNSEQNNRFNGDLSIGVAAMDALIAANCIAEEDKAAVKKTNLDRVLSFRETKSALAISGTNGKYEFGDIQRLHGLFTAMKGVKVEKVYRADSARNFITDIFGTTAPRKPNERETVISNAQPKQSAMKLAIRTRRSGYESYPAFGGKLKLKSGDINNLYRDIESIYEYYQKNKAILTPNFVAIFRMSLRLLAETAAQDISKDLQSFVKDRFDDAKKSLDQDARTLLSSQNVDKDSITRLLQNGAHNYSAAKNEHQAIAISIILGAILTITHAR